jgi:hypothetical protein
MAKRKAKRHGRGRNREGTGNGAINPISAMKNWAMNAPLNHFNQTIAKRIAIGALVRLMTRFSNATISITS